jgi:hypothetical protein
VGMCVAETGRHPRSNLTALALMFRPLACIARASSVLTRPPATAAVVPIKQQLHEIQQRIVSEALGGGIIYLEAGDLVQRNADVFYKFRPHSNYAYVAGYCEPGSGCILDTESGARPPLRCPPHEKGSCPEPPQTTPLSKRSLPALLCSRGHCTMLSLTRHPGGLGVRCIGSGGSRTPPHLLESPVLVEGGIGMGLPEHSLVHQLPAHLTRNRHAPHAWCRGEREGRGEGMRSSPTPR